jgi:HEAT repeat protein
VRLALAAASHPAAEVRRRACQYLAERRDSRHVRVLVSLVDDPDSSVVLAALTALAATGSLDDPRPLVKLLAHSSPVVRQQAAETLAVLRFDEGRDALVRLAADADPNARRQAALAMGRVGDRVFVAPLVRMLDDRTSVQQGAVESLRRIVGQDIGNPDGSPRSTQADQVRRWKEWHSRR